MVDDDKRLIEDFLPIRAITRENTTGKGHINTLHLWWARRPLLACRAAVYSALVPVLQFVPNGANEVKKKSLGRANAARFIKNLCQYPAPTNVVIDAQHHILNAHAARLSKEQGITITAEDIETAKAPRPKILDMFAGGGAIPLEALRLGCDVYANELNPVAYLIELCTLVYPQKYGRSDSQAQGMTGRKSTSGLPTWGGLAEEVRYWGQHVYKNVRAQVGDLYPLVPDPAFKGRKPALQQDWFKQVTTDHVPPGYLVPVAYLWTRTITCKKPNCQAQVPLVRQTWVCKRGERFVALKPRLDHASKTVRYEIVEASTERSVGFDPSAGGSACPFCHTVIDGDYAKEFGKSFGFGIQPMAIMCVRPGETGKVYLPFEDAGELSRVVEQRLLNLTQRTGVAPPDEPLEANPRSFDVHRYGFVRWRQVFTERQNLMLLTCAAELQEAWKQMEQLYDDYERRIALYTCVALTFSRLVAQHNAFSFLQNNRETIQSPWGDGKFPMSWDFTEANPFSGVTASYKSALEWASKVYDNIGSLVTPASVLRGSASELPFADSTFDAVITDPPYYDSVSYSNLADVFYIWLKRSFISHL